ncbi:uncharacterized protein FIBRA_01815 [Fibroporia radiculosa]|uniref:Ribosome recycling factor domain-containing protein n=1 Tax=Fibroporia radiculosa TaxID=599839 RepID=J4G171_9APHY|nr:uncharacterized protein FIBRA_01815 [Fibroporia radiculosa]CCL99793.1 predicted protein [Fibroporia radiculosa]
MAAVLRSSSALFRLRPSPRICSLTASSSLDLPACPRYSSSRAASSKRKTEKEATSKESKSKHSPVVSTENLIPGSQRMAAGDEYIKAEAKMKGILDELRKSISAMEMRASGRVTPSILSPVRVNLGERGDNLRLEEIATVGVVDGRTLVVTVFEEDTLKHVEGALYSAKIPGVVPHRSDSRTIKIPIPKATVEARHAVYTVAQRKAEEARMRIRKLHTQAIKNYGKHALERDELQSLVSKYLGEIDKFLEEVKKSTGSK